jgi:hypothetical protein
MGYHVLNHFGSNGDSPNLFEPGLPLSFDMDYYKDGVLDFLDGAGEISELIEDDVIPDPCDLLAEAEADDSWAEVMAVEFHNNKWDLNEPADLPPEQVGNVVDECACTGQCGCNHRNRAPETHSKKELRLLPNRRGNDHRRLARNRRQSIRHPSPEVADALKA